MGKLWLTPNGLPMVDQKTIDEIMRKNADTRGHYGEALIADMRTNNPRLYDFMCQITENALPDVAGEAQGICSFIYGMLDREAEKQQDSLQG